MSKVTKRFGVDFNSPGGALTLSVSAVSKSDVSSGEHSLKHRSGWTIKGEVHEDYFTWVNSFEAKHAKYGRVWGNFEHEVYATSNKAFVHFWKHHEPNAWDYWDI